MKPSHLPAERVRRQCAVGPVPLDSTSCRRQSSAGWRPSGERLDTRTSEFLACRFQRLEVARLLPLPSCCVLAWTMSEAAVIRRARSVVKVVRAPQSLSQCPQVVALSGKTELTRTPRLHAAAIHAGRPVEMQDSVMGGRGAFARWRERVTRAARRGGARGRPDTRMRRRRVHVTSSDPRRPQGDLRTTNRQDSTDAPAMVASSISRIKKINFFGPQYVSH